MPAVILKIKFDDTDDPKYLAIKDYSEWLHLDNFPAYIYITLPGASEPIVHTLNKHTENVFNSNTLYTGCAECEDSLADLPDGIYKGKIQSSYEQFFNESYYLKTDILRQQLNKKYISLGFRYTDEVKKRMEYLNKIEYYITSAKANVQDGFIAEGNKLFLEAQELIKCNNC